MSSDHRTVFVLAGNLEAAALQRKESVTAETNFRERSLPLVRLKMDTFMRMTKTKLDPTKDSSKFKVHRSWKLGTIRLNS